VKDSSRPGGLLRGGSCHNYEGRGSNVDQLLLLPRRGFRIDIFALASPRTEGPRRVVWWFEMVAKLLQP
jgi:hypothetical protein